MNYLTDISKNGASNAASKTASASTANRIQLFITSGRQTDGIIKNIFGVRKLMKFADLVRHIEIYKLNYVSDA